MAERTFTVRLGDIENEELKKLKKLIGEATDNGAIKYIIRHYAELDQRYNTEMSKNETLSKENRDIKQKVKSYISSYKDLEKIK